MTIVPETNMLVPDRTSGSLQGGQQKYNNATTITNNNNKMANSMFCAVIKNLTDFIKWYFREGILFMLGNPLLDVSAEVDGDFLEK